MLPILTVTSSRALLFRTLQCLRTTFKIKSNRCTNHHNAPGSPGTSLLLASLLLITPQALRRLAVPYTFPSTCSCLFRIRSESMDSEVCPPGLSSQLCNFLAVVGTGLYLCLSALVFSSKIVPFS